MPIVRGNKMMNARRYRELPRYRELEQQVQVLEEEDHRMLPCRFFINGLCVRGGRCSFYHPSPAFLPTSMRVPPFPSDFMVSDDDVTSTYENGLVSFQYPNGGRQSTLVYEEDEEVPPASPPEESPTLFTHINWNEFLLPGESPPPLVAVPLEKTEKPRRGKCFLDLTKLREEESSKRGVVPQEVNVGQKMLTPKEELHLKVQLIAQGLEKETINNVPKIRSFFQNYENLENMPAAMIIRSPEPIQASGWTTIEKSTNEQLTDTDDGPCTSDEDHEGRTYSDCENIPPV